MIALAQGKQVTRVTLGNPRTEGVKTLEGSATIATIGSMPSVMAEQRTRKYLDTGEVASLLERSRKWVRDRFDRGVFFGYRDEDDDIRKIAVESLRSYMSRHRIDQTELDEYLESHP